MITMLEIDCTEGQIIKHIKCVTWNILDKLWVDNE